MQTKAILKRNNQIYKNYLEGKTRSELAKEHILSDERIRQICNRLKMQQAKAAGPISDQTNSLFTFRSLSPNVLDELSTVVEWIDFFTT